MERIVTVASFDDVATISQIIRKSFAGVAERFSLTAGNAPTHPSNCQDKWISAALDKGIKYYLATLNNFTCGCVAMESSDAGVYYMERLAVLPEFRRKGLGQRLVAHVIAEVRALGANRLEIGIIKKHIELKHWYLKQGFVKKNSARFEQLPFEVLFMYLDLNQ